MKRHVLIFGLVGGVLIAILQYTEYRFVIIEHSIELYSAADDHFPVASGFSGGGKSTTPGARRDRSIAHGVVSGSEMVPVRRFKGEPFETSRRELEGGAKI